MKRLSIRILAMLSLVLGFALRVNAGENNSWIGEALQPQTDEQASPLQFAKAVKSKSVKVSTKKSSDSSDEGGLWVGLYTGYDFVNLGGLGSEIKELDDYAKSLGDNSVIGTDHSGLVGGVEFGLALDSHNALTLNVENTWSSRVGLDITTGGDAGTFEEFDPTLLAITLNYDLTLVKDAGGETTLVLGTGFYHGAVHIDSNVTGTEFGGSFASAALGGVLGVTQELSLGGGLALDFSAKFRAADFGKLTADSVKVNGASTTSGAPYALVSIPQSGYHLSEPVPTSVTLPSNIHYTDLDYTGFTGNIGLKITL